MVAHVASASGHWAFQPVKRPPVPAVVGRAHNPIDAFILSRLEREGASLADAADPVTLIRRLSFDLVGLPPTPHQVDAFVAASKPDPERAYRELVDRLLASPRYGERWARHWLDVARYAETDGFEHDLVRQHAWRYRDYVIESFNRDKPYDRFIREQVAGDVIWPGDPQALIATGFNLLGPDMVDSSDQEQRRLNRLTDMTDTTSLVFLGLTMGCAKCHDHPFEPIKQRDYYRLQAFYTPLDFHNDTPVPTALQASAYRRALERYKALPEVRALAEFDRAHRPTGKKLNHKAYLRSLTKDERETREGLEQAAQRHRRPELPKALTVSYPVGKWRETRLLHRGDYKQPRELVKPRFPGVLPGAEMRPSDRGDLANWITSPDNPLTARVMVNRIWAHHFHRGLVATPSDFGKNAQPPSHPKLLDWLASEFTRQGWSVKAMHRLILNSRTWRQSASLRGGDTYAGWRPKRLEAEALRDSLLKISGRLNGDMFGPGVMPPIPRELFAGAKGWSPSRDAADHARRSVYIFARRNLRFPFLEVFDAPDSNLSCAAREQSTTAPQSLTLLNADEVVRAARLVAASITSDPPATEAYRRILGRAPSTREHAVAERFLTHSPVSELCRALFNLNEFVYVH